MDAHIFHHWLFKKKYTEDHTTVGNRNNEKKIRGLFGLIHQAVSMDFKGWEQDVIYTPLFFLDLSAKWKMLLATTYVQAARQSMQCLPYTSLLLIGSGRGTNSKAKKAAAEIPSLAPLVADLQLVILFQRFMTHHSRRGQISHEWLLTTF